MTDPEGLAARRAALTALTAIEDGAWSTRAVPDAVAGLPQVRDRAFAAHLAYETTRWRGSLDELLGEVISRPLSHVEPGLLLILRIGALQLWRSSVPAHAAVATSVALAREVVPPGRAKGAAGFVNGSLRALARRIEALVTAREDNVAFMTGHPAWVVHERTTAMGPTDARELLEADNDAPGVTLRAVADRDQLVAELVADGHDAVATALAEMGIRVPGVDPRQLSCVNDGRATPQDEASMLVAMACQARPGDRVLDLCAAPGGKATHLASIVGDAGHVTAVEVNPDRARLIEQNAQRLGVEVDVRVADARTLSEVGFDIVLIDAPCTGLGTGRRRPEVRHRRQPDDVRSLATLQRELLASAADRVKPGGVLVYSVCTWTTAETVDVMNGFEADQAQQDGLGFVREEERQLLPSTDGTDGMFFVRWRRRDHDEVVTTL